MKFHKLTIVFFLITIVLVILNAYKLFGYATWSRHYYTAAVGFAEYHPIQGNFKLITKNGEELKLRDHEDFGGWGKAYNIDLEYMQLPRTLSAHWIALRERKIYKGTFELPFQKIDSLFRMDNQNKELFEPYDKGEVEAYTVSIGVEPGGYITLWLEGNYKYQKEIAKFKAERTDKYLENATEKESINIMTERLFERSQTRQLDSIFKNKIPADTITWKNYSKKYPYFLKFEDFPPRISSVNVTFFNEEKDEFNTTNNTKHFINSGVPHYSQSNLIENEKFIHLKFTEELMDAFKKKQLELTKNDTMVYIIKYNKSKKSMQGHLTTIQEISR